MLDVPRSVVGCGRQSQRETEFFTATRDAGAGGRTRALNDRRCLDAGVNRANVDTAFFCGTSTRF